TCRLARLFKVLGFSEFKLKLGYHDDEERVAALRRAVGARHDLRVDANAGWDIDTALRRCEVLKKYDISSLEQPVAAADLTSMARIRQEGGVAVIADESLCNRSDAEMLIKAEACDIFNIRLGKCGGYLGSLEILRLARAARLACQLGVLVGETSILTAAGQEFLAGTGMQLHHETSFPRFFLKHNPASGDATPFWRGRIRMRRPRPGFGVTINKRVLKKVTVRHLAVG
ncbi:MAG: hypothetical protein JXA52_00040, partial [Planctomycetes bacterium]|nr:hypothetical protein [Planctomycetota bacterium]